MEVTFSPESSLEKIRLDESWGTMWWIVNKDNAGADVTFGRVIIKSGKSNPRHLHPTCQEVLHLTEGKLSYFIEDDKYEMLPGDTLVIPPGKGHYGLSTGPSDAVMLVCFSSGTRDFQKLEQI